MEKTKQEINPLVEISDGWISMDNGIYEIELSRIKTERHIDHWVCHLCEKNWVTTGLIREFVIKVRDAKGWRSPF